jgi:hypothetical protein
MACYRKLQRYWERVHSLSEGGRETPQALTPRPLSRLEFASLIRATLSHEGRGEESAPPQDEV